jgi:hypothetical protein
MADVVVDDVDLVVNEGFDGGHGDGVGGVVGCSAKPSGSSIHFRETRLHFVTFAICQLTPDQKY